MTLETHKGSCHCGAVRFQCDIDLEANSLRCNCTVCAKGRSWLSFVKDDAFRLIEGAGQLADYQFGALRVHHRFCKTCGIKVFGEVPGPTGTGYAINLACLDDVTAETFARIPVMYADGLNDRWDAAPVETAYL